MRNLILILISLMLAASLIYIYILDKRLNERDTEKKSAKKAIQVEADIIARKIDKQGIEYVTIEAAKNIIPHSEVKNSSAVGAGILDTTAMAIGILKKQLKEVLVINSTLNAENLAAKEEVRNGQRYLSYADKRLGMSYRPPLTGDTIDKGTLNLDYYNSEISISQYWKRKWFLAATKGYIDISTNVARNTENGAKQLTVEQKSRDFNLRVQGSANYNSSNGQIGFGPAVRVDIGRFSIQGNYNWYPEQQKWTPIINANYDLIRF
ncbi:hypothetical protein [Pedobacter sp.]